MASLFLFFFFCCMSLKFALISILAKNALFIYDVIIYCLKFWYLLFTSKEGF